MPKALIWCEWAHLRSVGWGRVAVLCGPHSHVQASQLQGLPQRSREPAGRRPHSSSLLQQRTVSAHGNNTTRKKSLSKQALNSDTLGSGRAAPFARDGRRSLSLYPYRPCPPPFLPLTDLALSLSPLRIPPFL